MQLVTPDARKHRKINHKNGRERPHFFGFNPPKKFLRSLPPVLGIRQQTRFAGQGSSFTPVDRPQCSPHDDLNEFRIKACMAGPQGGETPQCPS